jgi:hypothetical protein
MVHSVRRCLRLLASAVLAGGLTLAGVAGVAAASHQGCSAEASGWSEYGIEEAAATIWDSVVAKDAFPGGIPDLAAALAGLDKNGDGDLCLLRIWGDDLNPNAHWYKVGLEVYGMPVTANYLRDNTANARDG